MQIKLKTPLFLILFFSSAIHAQDFQTDIIEGCQKIDNLGMLGQQAYQKKNYRQALDYFQDQASWSHFCTFHEDMTGKKISENQLATAYNNVGLTYSKLQQPRWAKVWYSLFPEDSKSKFNLKQLGHIPIDKNKVGTYVKYIGQGTWDTIEVNTVDQNRYEIQYSGLRMGINGLVVGPNMGEFSTYILRKNNKLRYTHEDCVIDLQFNQGESIEVKQHQTDCGFGMGVSAEGRYLKVEKLQDYSRYN